MNTCRKASIHSLDFQGETLGGKAVGGPYAAQSVANATKPVSYRQRGETGLSTAKGVGR